jgi:hypothetical protein
VLPDTDGRAPHTTPPLIPASSLAVGPLPPPLTAASLSLLSPLTMRLSIGEALLAQRLAERWLGVAEGVEEEEGEKAEETAAAGAAGGVAAPSAAPAAAPTAARLFARPPAWHADDYEILLPAAPAGDGSGSSGSGGVDLTASAPWARSETAAAACRVEEGAAFWELDARGGAEGGGAQDDVSATLAPSPLRLVGLRIRAAAARRHGAGSGLSAPLHGAGLFAAAEEGVEEEGAWEEGLEGAAGGGGGGGTTTEEETTDDEGGGDITRAEGAQRAARLRALGRSGGRDLASRAAARLP